MYLTSIRELAYFVRALITWSKPLAKLRAVY